MIKKLIIITILIEILLGSSLALSTEYKYLRRSPRALLMGDAYTAVADDEYTLFYNPAALGRHNGLSVWFIDPEISVTNVLNEMDRFEDFPERDAVAIADRILGFPFHLGLGATPGLKMQHFGMNLFANMNTDITLRNAIHPALDLDYIYDRGFIMGYAFTFGSGGRGTKKGKKKDSGTKSSGTQTSIGFSVKNMNRQGISESFDLFGLQLLNEITSGNSDDIEGIKRALGYSYGKGWGWDVGLEHTITSSYSQFNTGFSIMDVFDTRFRRIEGEKKMPKQEMTMAFGTSWTQDFYIFDYTLSADIHPINHPMPFLRKLHFGVEIGIPFISVLAGWSAGYISYGASFSFWPISIYAGFYGIELGSDFKQEEGGRAIVYLSLLDFSFGP